MSVSEKRARELHARTAGATVSATASEESGSKIGQYLGLEPTEHDFVREIIVNTSQGFTG